MSIHRGPRGQIISYITVMYCVADNIVVAVGQVPDDIPTDTAGVTTLSSRRRGYGRAAG